MEVRKMYDETITIDVDALREDMKNECLGAFFGGGFGGALIEAGDIEKVDSEQLVQMAINRDIDLRKYQI